MIKNYLLTGITVCNPCFIFSAHNRQTIETQYLIDSERLYSEVVLERTQLDQVAWSETLYVHTLWA